MFSESFPKILEVDPSWREWRWSQQPGFSPRGMLIKAEFFLGERSLPLFPSLAELRKKQFPFFWCWLTQNYLHFKNKPMFVSIVFAVWNPLLNSVKRKWDHWHPPSYFSFFTNRGQLCSELYSKGAPQTYLAAVMDMETKCCYYVWGKFSDAPACWVCHLLGLAELWVLKQQHPVVQQT